MVKLTRPAEVFVSYAHEDESLRDRLVKQLAGLEQEGLIRCWHDRRIGAGREWKDTIEERLNAADLILMLVSDDYMQSEFCRSLEIPRALERHERREARVVPVILRACGWQETALAGLQALPTGGKPIADWPSEDAALSDVVRGVRAAVEDSRAPALPKVWNVPFRRNPHFTGRGELLAGLRSALNSGQPAAVQVLHGLGGVGKTLLAVEYAYRHARDYSQVWWLRAEEPVTLAGDYARLADQLDLPLKDDKDQSLIVKAVRRWLGGNRGWLLVFDNAEKPEDLGEYLPQTPQGHVIITSRSPNWRNIGGTLPVEVLPREQAIQLLLRRSGSKETDRDAAAKLAEELGDLPLALEQAAAYVDETGTTLGRYLELLSTHRKEVLSRKGVGQEYPASVATTWEISFQRLEKESPAAVELMNLCAFLAPEAIPLDLLANGKQHLPESLSQTLADPVARDELKAALRRYSLAEVKDDDITLHRLVQAVTRSRLTEEGRRHWAESAIRLFAQEFPESPNAETQPRCARLLAHAAAAAIHSNGMQLIPDVTSLLLSRLGGYAIWSSQNQEAESLLRRALKTRGQLHGDAHPDVAEALNDLAVALHNMGRLEEAETLYQRAWGVLERVSGQSTALAAQILNNLGTLYTDLARYDDAERVLVRALEMRQQILGPDHPEVAQTLSNLAAIYNERGRYAEAEPLLRRSLDIRERALGADDLAVSFSLNNLGFLCKRLGRNEEAEAFYRRAVQIKEKALGVWHPDVATALANLAVLCHHLGKRDEALRLHARAREIRERVLGPNHPDTAYSLNSLADCYVEIGRLAEAEPLARRALHIWEEAFGPQHPQAARALTVLAKVYDLTGRAEEAKALRGRAGQIRQKQQAKG
jgi:tetratricopeptide (TPR) repeat protein